MTQVFEYGQVQGLVIPSLYYDEFNGALISQVEHLRQTPRDTLTNQPPTPELVDELQAQCYGSIAVGNVLSEVGATVYLNGKEVDKTIFSPTDHLHIKDNDVTHIEEGLRWQARSLRYSAHEVYDYLARQMALSQVQRKERLADVLAVFCIASDTNRQFLPTHFASRDAQRAYRYRQHQYTNS